MHKLGILCSQFPEMHETFVIRELNALKNGGIDLRVYSLKPCRDKVIHEDSKALMASTYYPGHFMAVFFQAAGTLFRQPLPSLQTLFWTLSNNLFPVSGFIKSAVAWWISLAMVETIRKDGITHLHAHWANYPTTSAVILSKLLGIPFSFTAHAFDIFVRNPSLKPKLHLAEKIITCTDFNRRYLAQLVPECSGKILLNYHGVNTQKFKPESRDQALKSTELPLLLSIGRLVEQKGYEDLLTAYGKLLQKGGRFRALIIGGGPLQKKLSTRIRQLGLEKIVEMKSGYSQAQIKGFMQSAYAFVLPCVVAKNNDRDGIPNVILEAMSMGLPTVSTTVSGVPEAVWDQRTGLLVHERDPEMLYQALDLLLRNPVYTSQLGARAREFAIDKFSEFVHMKRLTWEMKKILRIVADSAHDPEETDAPLSHSRYSTQRPNPRAIKVAHIIWSLEIGGAERAVQAIAEGLDPENFRSIVICLNQEGRLSAALKAKGIPVFALRKKGAVDIAMLFRLIRILKNEKIEILHAHLFGASLWGRLAGKIAGIPILIAHEHGM